VPLLIGFRLACPDQPLRNALDPGGCVNQVKGAVLELVRSIRLRRIDVGSLPMARALEALAALNISVNTRHGWSWQSGWKLIGPTG
jgi:hypothetical protein